MYMKNSTDLRLDNRPNAVKILRCGLNTEFDPSFGGGTLKQLGVAALHCAFFLENKRKKHWIREE